MSRAVVDLGLLVGAKLEDGVEKVGLFGRPLHHKILHQVDSGQGTALSLAELFQ